ncbi:MAG: ATP-binding protein [Eggerthellaceae bacterium]|nr:ATP-binding protein [Eggerthellaceae bacterium]
MQREIMTELVAWKDMPRRKPLMITGVRQCGKTYIVEKFSEECFDSFVRINFEETEAASAVFEYDFDVKRILSEIEYLTKQKVTAGKTLLFFDEIQQCPRAVTALKYFCENMPELHVVCAGSLLGVALARDKASFPVGKVNRLRLYPMSFKEFAVACGQGGLVEMLSAWPSDRPIPELYARPMGKLLKEFYAVGGMPEAVATWLDTRDLDAVERVQREILADYADDFAKYAPLAEVPKIRWIWDSVPVQLAKENNKFVFSHVKAGKRSADLEDALQWLSDAGLISRVHLVEKPELPLSGFADRTYFKVYMSDIGLLRVRSGVSAETVMGDSENYRRFKGAFAENYVLNELVSQGKEPFFWRSGNTAEVDFVYESDGDIVPVEVKAADNTQAKSYRQFCKVYEPAYGFKMSEKNMGVNMCERTQTTSLPLYLCWNMDGYALDRGR